MKINLPTSLTKERQQEDNETSKSHQSKHDTYFKMGIMDLVFNSSTPMKHDIQTGIRQFIQQFGINKQTLTSVCTAFLTGASRYITLSRDFVYSQKNFSSIYQSETAGNVMATLDLFLKIPQHTLLSIFTFQFLYNLAVNKKDLTQEAKPIETHNCFINFTNRAVSKLLLAAVCFVFYLKWLNTSVSASYAMDDLSYFLLANAIIYNIDFRLPAEQLTVRNPIENTNDLSDDLGVPLLTSHRLRNGSSGLALLSELNQNTPSSELELKEDNEMDVLLPAQPATTIFESSSSSSLPAPSARQQNSFFRTQEQENSDHIAITINDKRSPQNGRSSSSDSQ